MLKEDFIKRARDIHGDKYIYDKVPKEFKANDGVVIICPIHGEFTQCARTHYRGHGCPCCKVEKTKNVLKLTTESFLAKYEEKFGKKYDTSLVEYKDFETSIKIICPKHGVFEKTPHELMRGNGCPKCGLERRIKKKTWTREKFIEMAKKVHGDDYIYDKVEYVKQSVDVIITCPIHGDFKQTPRKHLMGSGCPKCNSSKLELTVNKALKDGNIDFIYQGKKRKIDWIDNLSLDFYIPSLNIAIECQGGQHFVSVERFGGDIELKKRAMNDLKKKKLCKDNGVKLVYFLEEKYNEYMKENDVYFNTIEDLMKYIGDI